MKRSSILFLVLLAASCLFEGTYAAGCTIESAPDKKLQEYLKGVDTIVSKAVAAAAKSSCRDSNQSTGSTSSLTSDSAQIFGKLQAGARKATEMSIASINEGITVGSATTSFSFLKLLLQSELPPAIRRDNALLGSKEKRIMSAIDAVYGSCGEDLPYPDKSPFPNYEIEGRGVGELLGELLGDHALVMKMYRTKVVGVSDTGIENHPPQLVPEGFEAAMEEAYGAKAIRDCNSKESKDTLWGRVKERIERIGELGGGMADGMQAWKDAFALLDMPAEKSDAAEKKLLRAELSRQGLNTSQAQSMMNNLDSFNKKDGGEWRGLSASVDSIGAAVNKGIEAAQSVYDSAAETYEAYVGNDVTNSKTGQPDKNKAKNVEEYIERYSNVKALKTDVMKEVSEEYEKLVPLTADTDVSVDKTLGQIVEMHVILSRTLKNVEPYKEKARKACKDQATSEGGAGCEKPADSK